MIFGTDGIRARVGNAPLNAETIEKLSAVLAEQFPADSLIVLGSDTRESCALLRSWITSRLGNLKLVDLGVVPTPVVAFETRARGAQLGIMITASHNPAPDNGLKFFTSTGLKLNYATAQTWSALVEAKTDAGEPKPATLHPVQATHYTSFILENFSAEDFEGLRVAFDLAHGAGSHLVPELLEKLGVEAQLSGNAPNGTNINDGVGALHPQKLSADVVANQLDIGFALDGDGDRLIVTAPEEVHGDIVLFALYENLVAENHQPKAVVGTIMCGMGLEKAFRKRGVELIRTPVGDQNVLAEMVSHGHILGGEPSGHLIQADLFPAGDGFLGALRLARAMRTNRSLIVEASAAVPQFPTFEKAYKVRHKPALETTATVKGAIADLEASLGDGGRTIVRYSGTETKLRVYVEAADLSPYQSAIDNLEAAIARDLA